MDKKNGELIVLYHNENSELDSVIRGFAGAIPFIGTGIGEALTYNLKKKREERLKEAFDNMSKMLIKLGEEKIDKEYVESEEFQHLLVTSLELVMKTIDSEKRKSFSKLLVNSISIDKTDEERRHAEWFAETLGRMSYFHLLAFKIICSSEKDRAKLIADMKEVDKTALLSCVSDLESAGFLSFPFSTPRPLDMHMFKNTTLTTSGKDFVNWVLDTK